MYYVEIPTTWVDDELRVAAEEQLVETRDLFGLPAIDLKWYRHVGRLYAHTRGPREESRAAFADLGQPTYQPRVGRSEDDVLGFVLPYRPATIFLCDEPERYQSDASPEAVVVHECVHCYQHLAGYWGEMSFAEQEAMAYDVTAAYRTYLRERLLQARLQRPEAWFVALPRVQVGTNATWAEPSAAFLARAGLTVERLLAGADTVCGAHGATWAEYLWVPPARTTPLTLGDTIGAHDSMRGYADERRREVAS